jgi:hypothetical protein
MENQHFRLTKSVLVVNYGNDRHKLLFWLPVGVDIDILGSSAISGCVEILCNDDRYHVFKEDLLYNSTCRRQPMVASRL